MADDCWCKKPVLSTFRWVFPWRSRLTVSYADAARPRARRAQERLELGLQEQREYEATSETHRRWTPEARYFGQWRTGATQWAHTRGMRSRGTGTTRALPGSPFNQPPAVAIVASYAMSDRVSHDRYGLGTVVGTENGNAAVLVDFGPKVLRVALPTTKMVKL
jgi:hypothetical protein